MRQKWLILAIILTLAVPSVFAQLPKPSNGWGAKGENEPDTMLDANGGWMWKTSDITPVLGTSQTAAGNVHKVYFNAFQGTPAAVALSTSLTPNLASIGTRHASSPYQSYAMLGVWKDCNNDGYVGLADHGLFEYPSSVLAATAGTSICKVQSIPNPIPAGWFPVHNDGSWVLEWIPIGWDINDVNKKNGCTTAACSKDMNPWNINDEGARVWGDFGVPGAPGRFICWISNVPEGTYHTVGGIVDYGDCFSAGRVNANIATANGIAGTGGQWASVRATKNPWGEVGDGSYVTAFDCSQSQLAHVQPTETTGVGVSQPRVPTTSTAGSPAGTANETATAADDCDRSDNGNGEWEHAVARAPYSHEGPDTVNQGALKVQTDAWMNPTEGSRPPLTPAAAATNQLGRSTSKEPARQFDTEGFWIGRSVATTYNSFYTAGRDTIDEVKHWTYYAYVSPTIVSAYGLSMPKGTATGTYGVEACGASTNVPGAAPANGWVCDSAGWWPGVTFEKEVNNGIAQEYQVSIGQVYNLRDVDCFDESVDGARDAGITYGLATSSSCR